MIMGNQQPDWENEEERLKQILSIAREQLKQAKETAEKKKEEMIEAKKEVRENTSHSFTNLWSSEDFEALAELSQCINPVTDSSRDKEDIRRAFLWAFNAFPASSPSIPNSQNKKGECFSFLSCKPPLFPMASRGVILLNFTAGIQAENNTVTAEATSVIAKMAGWY